MSNVRLGSVVIAAVALALTGCSAAAGGASFTYAPPLAHASADAPTASPAMNAGASPAAAAASAAPSTATAAAAAATVSLTEWKVTVAGTIKAGKTTLTIRNVGAAAHELLVFKSNRKPSAYPTDAAGDIKEAGAGVLLVSDGDNIDPAGSQTRGIDLAPGTYLFVCNIPGHFKNGMFSVVTVTP